MKIFFQFLLIGSLWVPFIGTTGCAAWKQNSTKSNSVFSLPKKKAAKPVKPKKDPDVPLTVGDLLKMERNDVW